MFFKLLIRSRHFSIGTSQKYNVLYFGSDLFSTKCLNALLSKSSAINDVQVVVPFNQNQPLTKYALEKGLKFHRAPPHGSNWLEWKLPGSFDLAIVVSFGYFLPAHLLSQFPKSTINVHPSLLPKYRGSSPIQYSILNKDKETGVSIIELSPISFDSGKILRQSTLVFTH